MTPTIEEIKRALDSNGMAEQTARKRLADNGRNPANNHAGVRVGSDLHLCEMLLNKIEYARALLARLNEAQTVAVEHHGWLYENPDTGTEWSENNPIRSGECDDAKDARPATMQALKDELIEAWKGWEEARNMLAAVAVPEGWQLLPKEPDGWMAHAGQQVVQGFDPMTDSGVCEDVAKDVWRAMSALVPSAAPSAPASVEGWQPIETAPKDATWIALDFASLVDVGKPFVLGFWHGKRADWLFSLHSVDSLTACYGQPTRWFFIPAPPKEQSDEG